MGWLLNQAIDKMLEADTIHIYKDSVPPIGRVVAKANSTHLNELKAEVDYLRERMTGMASIEYVEKALEPVRLAISKASITSTPAKQSAIQTASAPGRDKKKKSGTGQ